MPFINLIKHTIGPNAQLPAETQHSNIIEYFRSAIYEGLCSCYKDEETIEQVGPIDNAADTTKDSVSTIQKMFTTYKDRTSLWMALFDK